MADQYAINVLNLDLRLFHGTVLFLQCATLLPSMDMSMELWFQYAHGFFPLPSVPLT